MSKVLVLPDIHGRNFWKEPCKNIDDYEKVIFLGDYLDPYDFDGISIEDAIDNFKDILLFAKKNTDKVVLLLGNHDMPYFSETYFGFSWYHSRHSKLRHDEIKKIFKENEEKFKIAHVENDVLFTHAGCTSGWLRTEVDEKYDVDIDMDKLHELCNDINGFIKTTDGLLKLYKIGFERGGRDRYASCIWVHWTEMFEDAEFYERLLEPVGPPLNDEEREFFSLRVKPIHRVRQVFGHTIQAYRNFETGKIEYGKAIEKGNLKMLDNAKAYELDTESFLATEANVKKG